MLNDECKKVFGILAIFDLLSSIFKGVKGVLPRDRPSGLRPFTRLCVRVGF
jgi:hypothetical protein